MRKTILRIIRALNLLSFGWKNYRFPWNFFLAIFMGNPSLRLSEVLCEKNTHENFWIYNMYCDFGKFVQVIFKRYAVYNHLNRLIEVILMITHNITLLHGKLKYYTHNASRSGAITLSLSVVPTTPISNFQGPKGCASPWSSTVVTQDQLFSGGSMLLFFLLCLCLTSYQQIRSYGDGATALSLIWQTGEARNRTSHPWFIRQAVYSLHHSAPEGSMFGSTEQIKPKRTELYTYQYFHFYLAQLYLYQCLQVTWHRDLCKPALDDKSHCKNTSLFCVPIKDFSSLYINVIFFSLIQYKHLKNNTSSFLSLCTTTWFCCIWTLTTHSSLLICAIWSGHWLFNILAYLCS